MTNSSDSAPLKMGPHYRAPWCNGDPRLVLVHARYGDVLGTQGYGAKEGVRRRDRYDRAKHKFDEDAAFEIVDECFDERALDRIIDCLDASDLAPIVAIPHPEWDAGEGEIRADLAPTNALPFALAYRLSKELGCDIDKDILQIARPGRSKLKTFQRFIWQPRFEGEPRLDHAYILADDVCHYGGTLAMLRSHIVAAGGTVVGATALACNDGKHVPFPIEDRTVAKIRSQFGDDVDTLWREEVGHDTTCLTEPEGIFLLRWGTGVRDKTSRAGDPILQRLREKITSTRAA